MVWQFIAIFLGGSIFGVLISRYFWKRRAGRIGEIYISPDNGLYMALNMTVEELSSLDEGLVWIRRTRK